MNPRLLAYLRSIGLAADASLEAAREFFANLEGRRAQVANLLDHDETDTNAQLDANTALRALGVDPENPAQSLAAPAGQPNTGQPNTGQPNTAQPSVTPAPGATLEARTLEPALSATQTADPAAEELRRVQEITAEGRSNGVGQDLIDRAIDESMDLSAARGLFLNAFRSQRQGVEPVLQAPAAHTRNSQTGATRDSLTAAMLLRSGSFADPTTAWPVDHGGTRGVELRDASDDEAVQRAVEEGDRMSSLSMVELAARALRADGVTVEPDAVDIGRAISEQIATRGATGVATLTGVFSTSYTAEMIAAFEGAPDTTDGWTRMRPVADYKLNERTRMTASSKLTERKAGQEADMTTFGDAKETYRVKEFAKQFVFDEQNLINDSFDSLDDFAPADMGESASELKPDIAYSILMANDNMRDGTPLFHADHGNLAVGALGVSTLQQARAAMQLQREEERELNLRMGYLIVSPSLEGDAEVLTESNKIITGSDTVLAENNPNARKGIRVISDSRLENGVTDPMTGTSLAGSATNWFAAAAGRPFIEIGYVRAIGARPRVRTSLLTQGRFGVTFDVQWALGGKALDWRGLLKRTAS